jgi:hypothetical protein
VALTVVVMCVTYWSMRVRSSSSFSSSGSSATLKSYVYLTDPIFLQGEWKHSWFDIARQQMLLFKDSTFYLWSPCAVDPGPTFFYSDTSWPAPMMLAKISIDSQLLAIQHSKTSIYVLDTIGGRKWRVDIKGFSGNEILPNGIIWSEHGGNSQDLVIVTSRGLELHKVSTARGQCKLSRNISIKTHFFWYEPNFRTILVAFTTPNYALEITGFFLRYDMSDMPRLELPPPDRMPAFTLGGGAGPQDVKLLTLYGKLYCAVRYSEPSGDILTLYHITKVKAERAYNFPLHMHSDIMLSVTDNLLCCHCLHYNVSLLLDLKLHSSSSTSQSSVVAETEYLCGACTMTVDNSQIKGPDDTSSKCSYSPQSSSPLKDNFLERAQVASSLPRTQSWTAASTSSQQGEWSDAVGVGGELGLDSLSFVSPASFPPVEPSTGVNINTGGFSRSRHNSISSNSAHFPPPSPPHHKSYLPSDLTPDKAITNHKPMESTKSEAETFSRPMLLSPVKSLSENVRYATEPYSGDWQIIFPYWCWIPTTRCLLKIKSNLPAIAASFHEPRRVVSFLALRGSPVIAPRPTFFADYEDSFEAKKILLTRLLTSIEDESLSVQWVNTFIDEMVYHYAAEYHRRSVTGQTTNGFKMNFDEDLLPSENPSLKSDNSSGSNSSTSPVENSKEDVTTAPAVATKPRRRLFNSMKSETSHLEATQDSSSQSLYLQSNVNGVPNRKISVNTQTITTLHLSRLKEQQELMRGSHSPLHSSPSFSTSSPPQAATTTSTPVIPQLEPNLDVHIFFPEIYTIGLRSFGKNETTSLPLSAPPPLSILRNEETYLFCTQTEIFSFVLLPLALKLVHQSEERQEGNCSNSKSQIEKLVWYLHTIISCLRSHSIPVTVSMSLLVINLLCYQKKYLEIAHTIQLQFLNDSPELAFAILEMSDLIEEEFLTSSSVDTSRLLLPSTFHAIPTVVECMEGNNIQLSTQQYIVQMRELKHSLVAIRQAGLDLLWRTQDKVMVVRWMLSHGIVMDAISLCTKIRGQWRAGLTAVSISGLDFFRSAISELCYIRQIGQLNSVNHLPLKYLGKNSLIRSYPSWRRSQSDINLLNHSLSSSHLQATPPSSEQLTGEMESLRFESLSTEQQGVHLLFAVHKFLLLWDPSLLTLQKVGGSFPPLDLPLLLNSVLVADREVSAGFHGSLS